LAEYSTLVDTIFPVVQSRSLQPSTLELSEKAFRSSHKLVWQTAGRYLVALSHYFPQALDRVRQLGRDSTASIRLRVVQSQWTSTVPEPLLTELLVATVRDGSKQVRIFAACRCGQLTRKDLLDLLEAQVAAEPCPAVLESLRYAIDEIHGA
jgi:hypothetical protein